MRTIFIPAFQGVSGRMMFRTSIFEHLVKIPDTRFVIFVPTEGKKEYYQKELARPAVTFEVIPPMRATFAERTMSALKFYLLNSGTTALRRKMMYQESKNLAWYSWGRLLDTLLAHAPVRRAARFIDERCAANRMFAPFFEKYQPALVLSGQIFDDVEAALLREAKKRRVPVLALVTSWDKLTARAMIRVLPDQLLVPNEIAREEAIQYHSVPRERIKVVGTPQYDYYITQKPRPREEFLKRIGAQTNHKILVYCPMGKTYSDSDHDMIDLIYEARERGEIPKNVHILVRMQPNDPLAAEKVPSRPGLSVDCPGVRFGVTRGVDWDMTREDLLHLLDTLAYGDLFICYASSMSIDAAIFDKPVININFELHEPRLLSKSPTHFYRMTHYRHLVETGGVRFPKNRQELIAVINEYLAHPAHDRKGRARLVREQCGEPAVPLRGASAGERVAEAVRSMIRS